MKLREIVDTLALDIKAGAANTDVEVTGAYACDLLSYVMAKAKPGALWLTVQGHINIIAVAGLVGLSGIIVTEGSPIDPATVAKAEQEGVSVLATTKPTYVVAGELYTLGVR